VGRDQQHLPRGLAAGLTERAIIAAAKAVVTDSRNGVRRGPARDSRAGSA
jgi:hypothetical protein